MAKLKITEATTTIVDLLTSFTSEERQRIIQASLTLLGENASNKKSTEYQSPVNGNEDSQLEIFSHQTKVWMKQNNVSEDILSEVFHISDNTVDIIADSIPGKDIKSKTLNCYILMGISKFLLSGDTSFDDKSARILCENSGCYDLTNHAKYLKDKGNKITGSKTSSWKLTSPGLKCGADLIKQITSK